MASIIDPEKAKSLISEYRTQNAAAGDAALKTTDNQLLNGYFIDRKTLESILSNPNATGVSVHLAKHPDSSGTDNNHYTLMLAGAQPNTTEGATTPYESTGDTYGDVPPCPPWCSSLT